MDSIFSNKAFAEKIEVTSFDLLSDWNRVVTKQYGLFNEARNTGNRGTFVVDKEGKIQQVVIGNGAIDPTSTLDTCNILDRKLVVAPPKPE